MRQNRSPRAGLAALILLLIPLALLHLGVGGSIQISAGELIHELRLGPIGAGVYNTILWQIRLPRLLACLEVGVILGMVGAAYQAYFRNPLAEPYVAGVSSGAGVGGALGIVFGLTSLAGGLGIPICALVGGILTLFLLVGVSPQTGKVDGMRFLLAGIVIGAFLSGIMTLVLLAGGRDTNQILRWLLGSMTPMTWEKVVLLGLTCVVGAIVLMRQGRVLNLVAWDPTHASRLGVSSGSLLVGVLLAGTVMTGLTVGSVGVIGFLGMVAPHLVRRLVGTDRRLVLPASGLAGAGLLLVADLLAQKIVPGTEIPVGATMAMIGAPILIVVLRQLKAPIVLQN